MEQQKSHEASSLQDVGQILEHVVVECVISIQYTLPNHIEDGPDNITKLKEEEDSDENTLLASKRILNELALRLFNLKQKIDVHAHHDDR